MTSLPSIINSHKIAQTETPKKDITLSRYIWNDGTKNFVVFTELWTTDYKLTTDTKIFIDFDEAFAFYQSAVAL